ncbi:hypothetical protein GW17_00040112 [Ensete ventricosum]|nr:hypothetical protein GW17_00040112 [Ensete ventricosum]
MTLPSSTPINVVRRVMPSPYAVAAARPPYDSAISRGTTRVRSGVLTSSPPTVAVEEGSREDESRGKCSDSDKGIEEEGLRRLRRARHVEGSGDGRWIVGDYSGKMWMGSCREGNDSGWAVTFDHAVGMMLVMMTIEEGDSFWTAAVGRRGWGQRQAGSPRS